MFSSLLGEVFAEDSQPPALVVGEIDSILVGDGLQDFFEDDHLLGFVIQRLLKSLVDRAGDHDDQEL